MTRLATEVLPGARAVVVSLSAGALFVGALLVGSALGAILVADLADAGRFAVVQGGYAALAVLLGVGTWAARHRWRRPTEAGGP